MPITNRPPSLHPPRWTGKHRIQCVGGLGATIVDHTEGVETELFIKKRIGLSIVALKIYLYIKRKCS